MKFLILASIVVFSLVGIVGVGESFAEKDSGKVCGAELCSDIPRTCTSNDHRKTTTPPPLTRGMHGPYPRVADMQGNSLDSVEVDQQIRISVDLANGKECQQPFVLIIQISDGKDDSVVFLEWISGSMISGMSHSPSMMWMSEYKGNYAIQMFVWESLDNLFVLHPTAITSLRVD